MGSSSKGGGSGRRDKPSLSDHAITVRQRLHEALALAIKVDDNKERKWQCSDAEIQSHVLRTMVNFMGCVSPPVLQLPILKNTVSDMLLALEGIFNSQNERILSLAADTTAKLVINLGHSICQYDISGVVVSLSCWLSKCQLQVANSCVVAMNQILENPGVMRHGSDEETWKVLKENGAVDSVVCALQDYVDGEQPLEYLTQVASLLKTILLRWPPARYYVWKNINLIMKLGHSCSHPNPSVTAATLQLFAALVKTEAVVQGMEHSQPYIVRVECLKVCRHLMRSAKGCHMLISLYCEPVVQGIISAMSESMSPSSKKDRRDQMPLRMEAFRVALITCWNGDHHLYFWKLGIDKVLFDNLFGDCSIMNLIQNPLQAEVLLSKINECYVDTKAYIWDILGWLALHCEDEFLPKTEGGFCYLKVLISSACSAAKVMHRRHVSLPTDNFEFEPLRAVLQMLFSPSKYISSHAKHYLSESLRFDGYEYLDYLLASLELNATGDVSLMSDSLQTVVNIVSVGCYSHLSEYQIPILEKRGVQIISAIITRCLDSDIKISRSSITSHIYSTSNEKACCWSSARDWEGEDIILFHSLQALSLLLNFSDKGCDHKNISTDKFHCIACEISEVRVLADNLQCVLSKNFSPGIKWYATYVLSFFNFYGFPSKLGKRIEGTFGQNELADLQFILSNGQVLRVHSVILMARCPSLLPPEGPLDHNTLGDLSTERHGSDQKQTRLRREVRISDRVDAFAFTKILEYVYSGFIQVEGGLVKPLKNLAKFCGLKSLSNMLHRRLPRWGSDPSICDLTQAFEPSCHAFMDIILEAKATEGVAWNCSMCQVPVPHMHAHKIVLVSCCDYLRGLFQSGMQDSNQDVIKVPIGWNALVKLIKWMYSSELPRINPCCAWNNMDEEQKLAELHTYVELASLSEYWLIYEVQEECLNVILPFLKADQQISLKMIHVAASLDQWKIVEAAISSVASLYPKLRDAGDLENFDEAMLDMLQAEFVRYSREGRYFSG
ncbi:hypothetical protein J5N97_017753 [Dioscorea zingiberensis]|uniref:BTB domain-containing protein n=1 Tax=Dioscorea zingiberensis TaxID=325984 RepID=A0A9D5CNV2_9LILI|nr:hypothetical protein J5N97_017753 [Dioscorea zingiberensis]